MTGADDETTIAIATRSRAAVGVGILIPSDEQVGCGPKSGGVRRERMNRQKIPAQAFEQF
jgi:hypothetical protein